MKRFAVKHYRAGEVAKDHITGTWCYSPEDVIKMMASWSAKLKREEHLFREEYSMKHVVPLHCQRDLVCITLNEEPDSNEYGEISP